MARTKRLTRKQKVLLSMIASEKRIDAHNAAHSDLAVLEERGLVKFKDQWDRWVTTPEATEYLNPEQAKPRGTRPKATPADIRDLAEHFAKPQRNSNLLGGNR
jgi:hypothetical protein